MDIKVSSMTLLDSENSKAKAICTVVLNDEIALHGIKVVEGKNGLFVSLPQRKNDFNNEYEDIFFPTTAQAREQINNAVMERYNNPKSELKIQEQQEQRKAKSQITVSLKSSSGNNPHLKAYGSIEIDQCFVIKGVKITEAEVIGKSGEKENKTYVDMPAYQKSNGEYAQYAHPIAASCYDEIQRKAMFAYANLGKYTYKGVKFAELGEKEKVVTLPYKFNNSFAQKLMEQLDKSGIKYQAKISDTTAISVNVADKDAALKIKTDLKAALAPQKKENHSL